MQVGVTFPSGGAGFSPENVVAIGQKAETLGFNSLWTYDRLMYASEPKNGYQGRITPWPEHFQYAIDPLDTLSFLAANTQNITLGTNILNVPYYNPVVLARRITTLDILSKGRLALGIGLGWSEDEYQAAGVPWQKRGKRLDEQLEVMKGIWSNEEFSFEGEFFSFPTSKFMSKPVQQPHPPIYVGTFTEAGLKRVVKHANGWTPAGLGLEPLKQLRAAMTQLADSEGKSISDYKTVLRSAGVNIGATIDSERNLLNGSLEQVQNDLAELEHAGVNEIIVPIASPTHPSLDGAQQALEQMEAISAIL